MFSLLLLACSVSAGVTAFEYPFHFLQTISEPLGRTTSIRSEATTGNLTSLNVGGLATGYGYDTKGNRTSETDGLGRATTYTFDANGNQTASSRTRTTDQGATVTDERGKVTRYEYDSSARLTKTTYPVSRPSVRSTSPDPFGACFGENLANLTPLIA